MNVLTTLLTMDSGTARIAGYDVATETKKVRSAIGVTGQFASVDELLSGRENLQLMADLHHLGGNESKKIVERLLARFDLAESADKLSSTYSDGMRRKLDLAMTLVGRPRIIFLDEPNMILRVPSDGGAKSLRTLLARLDEHAIDVEEFTVQMPDLDDVFLALTGHSSSPAESKTQVITP
ncbi:ABC-type multidrug transport system ATPase subunit [Kibdelosporangium banguiense]|uniref:ABC-type multidrug transport system ATPase subunit n=1 Tax=Kibdelosporangium banguiense TaxID=1365924 RepID=A0ABS4TUM0_9PSEU|nr:ABC-type multidrug transport system ATPase subunit [Kibdelosporangium banguiense]